MFKRLLISYILIGVIPFLILALLISNMVIGILNEDVNKSTAQALNQVGKNVSALLENAKNTNFIVSMNNVLQDNLARKNSTVGESSKEIERIRNSLLYPGIFNNNYSSIEVYALNKEYYPRRHVQNDVMSDVVIRETDWYKETIKRNGKPYWHLSTRFNTLQLTISRVVFNVTDVKKPIAIISVDIDFSKIEKVISEVQLGRTGKVVLTNNKGEIILPRGKSFSFPSNLKLDNNNGSYYFDQEGKEMLLIYSTLPNTDWKIVGMVPNQELAEKSRIVKKTLYYLILANVIVAIAVSFYFSYNFSRPIRFLANQMKAIRKDGKGYLDMKVQTSQKGEIGILYSSFNFMIHRIEELIQEVYVSKIKKKDAEIKALQAQINPHFLYNTLDSINWLAIKYKAMDISKMVTSLASILRYSLNHGNETISIENELKQVRSYITIQKIRFSDKFIVDFNIENAILDKKMIKLLLQPLVENAIIHGIETFDGQGIINISGYVDEEKIIFEVVNNGNSIDIDKVNRILIEGPTEKEGHGISNVNNRIKLYYGESFGLTYYQYGDKTIAKIIIPLMTNED